MKYRLSIALFLAAGCFFPSLDDLGPGDGGPSPIDGGDAATSDASDAGPKADAPDASTCPSDPSLVAYYAMDEGAGTTVHDCSPNAYDGTLVGANPSTHWTTGHVGGGLHFVPNDGTCVLINSASANRVGAFTVSAWVRLDDLNGGYIVGQRTTTGFAWRIDVESSMTGPRLGFAIGAGAGKDIPIDTAMMPGAFHHVAVVYDPAGVQALFLDGVKTTGTMPPKMIVPEPNAKLRFGCRGDDTNFFNGAIDDVAIYSRVFTDIEIATLVKQ